MWNTFLLKSPLGLRLDVERLVYPDGNGLGTRVGWGCQRSSQGYESQTLQGGPALYITAAFLWKGPGGKSTESSCLA